MAAVTAATAVYLVLQPVINGLAPFLPYFVAVFACARYAGLGPTVLGCLASAVIAYAFWSPERALAPDAAASELALLGFLLVSGALAWFGLHVRAKVEPAREAVRRLRVSEEKFARAFAASPDGLVISRADDGLIREVNDAFLALFDYQRDEVIGRRSTELQVFSDSGDRAHLLACVRRDGRVRNLETSVRLRDGSPRRVQVSVDALEIAGEHSMLTLVRDVTARRQAQEELRRLESRFRAAQETSGDGFAILESIRDGEGRIADFRWVYINDAAVRFVGRTRESYIGRQLLVELPGTRTEGLFDGCVRVVESGTPWTTDFDYRHEGYDASLRITVAKVDDGFAITLADLSRRRRAEWQLRASEARFRSFADSIPALAWTADERGAVTFVNRQWCEYTGLTLAETLADGWQVVLHPEDLEETRRRWLELVAVGTSLQAEYRIRRQDGVYRWFLTRATPFRDEGGVLRGWFGTSTDIDDAKATERTLRQQDEALRAADRRKDEFLATLAHELRNPLAPIRYAARMLRGEPGPQELARAREAIERQSKHMARLLDDLLDMSRITRDVIDLKRVTLDLRQATTEALDSARHVLESAQHALTVTLPGEPVWVSADPTRLAQVIDNLLQNAAKYTDPGGRISVHVRSDGGSALLSVQDSGIGVPIAAQARVFELFSQIERADSRRRGGLGIGLSVVKRLVELHGGKVRVHSEGPGRGSEFTISLPSVEASASGGVVRNAVRLHGQRRRVLLVDDNADVVETLAAVLRLGGYPVHTATDGPTGVSLAETVRPDVVVLDLGMPGMSGHEVARAIRQQPWGKAMQIIAATGWGQEEDRRRTREAGFDAHLIKPIDPDDLVDLIEAGARRVDDGIPQVAR